MSIVISKLPEVQMVQEQNLRVVAGQSALVRFLSEPIEHTAEFIIGEECVVTTMFTFPVCMNGEYGILDASRALYSKMRPFMEKGLDTFSISKNKSGNGFATWEVAPQPKNLVTLIPEGIEVAMDMFKAFKASIA